MQIGFADRGGSITQCCLGWYARDAQTTSIGSDYVSSTWVSANVNPGASTPTLGQIAIAITAFGAQGFTAITQNGGRAVAYPYLALSYTTVNGSCGHSVSINNSTTIAAPATIIVNTPFKPQFVMQLLSGVPVSDSVRLSSEGTNAPGAGTYGIAGFTATELFSSCIGDDDAARTMDTESIVTNSFLCRSDIKTNLYVATTPIFNPLSWTLSYSTTSTTSRRWPTLVIGEFVAAVGAVDGVAALVSNFSVAAAGRMTYRATAIVSMVGSAAAVGREVYAGQAALASAFSVAAVGLVTRRATAVLASTFTTAATGMLALPGQAVLASVFSLGASPTGYVTGTATLASTFTTTADSKITFAAAGELVSVFAVAADGSLAISAAAALTAGFTVEAVATSIHSAETILASAFTVSPLGGVAYQCLAAISTAFTVVALGSKASEAPSSWQNYGVPRLYRVAKNAGLSFGLQVDMRAITGAVNARLYNMTDSEIVIGSELTTASSAFEVQTTSALALEDNKYYIPQLALSIGGTGEVKSAVPAVVN